jgi:hypothetical protein
VIRNGERERKQIGNRSQQALGLTQRLMEHQAQ